MVSARTAVAARPNTCSSWRVGDGWRPLRPGAFAPEKSGPIARAGDQGQERVDEQTDGERIRPPVRCCTTAEAFGGGLDQ